MVIRKFSKWGRALTKTITVLVLIAINLMPLVPVFAQVATDTSSGAVTPVDTSTPSSTPNVSDVPASTADTTPAAPAPADTPNNSATLAPTSKPVQPSKSPGAMASMMSGSNSTVGIEDTSDKRLPLQPDFSSGAELYQVPIDAPPGRSNLQPNFQLQYNNQSSDNQQVFGYGWSSNIPYIVRENKTGTDQLFATSSNYFFSSLSGELATTSATSTFVSSCSLGNVSVALVCGRAPGGSGNETYHIPWGL
jgi:hypothetical protein